MNKGKRIICFVLCMILLAPASVVQAKKSKDNWPKLSGEITAGSAILMNMDTGTILYSKKIDKVCYPASITKILTTLLALENSSMDEVVTFSKDAIYKTEGSGIWRDVGEKMTMEQCLYAVMLESANECAYAVAEHVAGSMSGFVDMMNERAKAIGCKNTHFANPHGLPDEDHYVTARDMALIAQEAYKNEEFRTICGTKRYTIPPTNKHEEPTYLQNHHKMLNTYEGSTYFYEYCTGGKTGYTVAAGNTLVTFAEKDGMSLVAVILKGSKPSYWEETRTLFNFGFDKFHSCCVSENIESGIDSAKYDTLNSYGVYAEIDPNAKIVLPKKVEFEKAKMTVDYEDTDDSVLAKLDFAYGKHKVGTANVIRTDSEIEDIDVILEETTEDEEIKQEEQKSTEEETNTNFLSEIGNKGKGIVEKLSTGNKLVILGIVIGIILVILLIVLLYNKSHNFRRNLANLRNERRERKQYTIIPDSKRKKK